MSGKVKINYINGVRVSTLKKIATFCFGDNYEGMKVGRDRKETYITVKKGMVKDYHIRAFEDYWKIKIKEL